jgi:POLQ-like helicase
LLKIIKLNVIISISEKQSANPNKRKSDEIIPDDENVFKSPQPPKKQRPSKSPLNPQTSLSQSLLEGLEDVPLTQTSDYAKDLSHHDRDIIEDIIRNLETCSQYIQLRHEVPMESLNDTLDDLFNNASVAVESKEAEKEKVHEYHDILEDDCDLLLDIDEESLKKSSLETRPALVRPKLLPVSSGGCFRELGSFFGLTKKHKDFILATKNIKQLYDWQEECLNLRAIHDRSNLIYALPTSGGKTLVAEIAMLREIVLRKKNVIFVLPYVSIVQEKVQDLMPFALEFDFLVEEYCAGKGSIPPQKRRKKNSIYICTIEKSQILFDSLYEGGRLDEIGLIVVDELHMVGDENRGYSLEMLLAKVNFQKDVKIQIIGMSATISNLLEIARFLNADVYTRDFRPVELKEYVKIGSEVLAIDGKAQSLIEAFKYERNVGDDYDSVMKKRDPDHIAGLVMEVCPKFSCLIFCATKVNCENVATLVSSLMPLECKRVKREEKKALIEAIRADSNGQICPVLAKTLPYGVAYHHSGLTTDERKHIEEAYRLGIICLICCTSTLAAGVNLPAKRVIIRSPYVGQHFLTLTRYKQMVGRAGRAGKSETGESILICSTRDYPKLTNLFCSKMDETVSGFVNNLSGKFMRTVVLNLIGTKIATNIDRLADFFEFTLVNVQINRLNKTLREMIITSCKELIDDGALIYTSVSSGLRNFSFKVVIGTDEIDVYPDDLLGVSKLGKAAVNAGMCLEDAQKIEKDLKKAHESLVLSQELHLLFIVVPSENVDAIKPDYSIFNTAVMRLESTMGRTAQTVGITESLAMKLVTRPGQLKDNEVELVKRFYIALILFELWKGKDIYEVAIRFKVNRGLVYGLMSSASSKAYSIFKFCEMYEEFWLFKEVLEKFSKRLNYCCSAELLPLMELPAVKIVSSFLAQPIFKRQL